jgi:hypothetical protein
LVLEDEGDGRTHATRGSPTGWSHGGDQLDGRVGRDAGAGMVLLRDLFGREGWGASSAAFG